MIVVSVLLIPVAVALLVLGLADGSSTPLISSIVASLLAAVVLVVGARRTALLRRAATATPDRYDADLGTARDPGYGAGHGSAALVAEPVGAVAGTRAGAAAGSGAGAARSWAGRDAGTQAGAAGGPGRPGGRRREPAPEPSFADNPPAPDEGLASPTDAKPRVANRDDAEAALAADAAYREGSDPDATSDRLRAAYGEAPDGTASDRAAPEGAAAGYGEASDRAAAGYGEASEGAAAGVQPGADVGSRDVLPPDAGSRAEGVRRDVGGSPDAEPGVDSAQRDGSSQRADGSQRDDGSQGAEGAQRADVSEHADSSQRADSSGRDDVSERAGGSERADSSRRADVSERAGGLERADVSKRADSAQRADGPHGADEPPSSDGSGFSYGAGLAEEFAEPDVDDPADEPLPQAVRPADALRVARMDTEVLVVDGRPRYHLADCPHLVGRLTEPLPAAEAVELGFSPCGLCRPVDRLVAQAAH
jgi:clumping factor A